MPYLITIPGTPIAKKRPRFARRGKFVTTYNSQETEEGRFLFEAQKQYQYPPIETPIHLFCCFYMPIPKGTSKKKINLMELNQIKHTKKPDLDNLIKFVKDCLNGLVWKDDSQVFSIEAVKLYDQQPRTIIKVEEVA